MALRSSSKSVQDQFSSLSRWLTLDSERCAEQMMTIYVARDVPSRNSFDEASIANTDFTNDTGHTENNSSFADSPPSTEEPSPHDNDVGDMTATHEVFPVKKEPLRALSPYFVALDNFKEGRENVVILNDPCASSFSILADWINTGHRDWQNPYSQDVDVLVQAYALGRRFLMPKFQNFVIDEIRQFDRDDQINSRRLLELQELGFQGKDQITQYFLDRLAYRAAVTDFWSFTEPFIPLNSDKNDEGFHESNLGHMLLPLLEKIVHFMRQVRPFATGADGHAHVQDAVDPRVDQEKSYHI